MMIFGVPSTVLPTAARQRLEATLARLDPRTMPRANGARPIGSFHADPQRIRTKATKAEPAKSHCELAGVALTFNKRSAHWVKLSTRLQERIGTRCSSAHITYKPGAFDWNIRKAVIGNVRYSVDLELFHDPDTKLCSTISGALQLRATKSALLFRVRAKSRDGRYAVRMANLLDLTLSNGMEVSVSVCPINADWHEPNHADEPGELIVHEGRLLEISLLEHGAHGGTFAFVS